MPLSSVRLIKSGFQPSAEVTTRLQEEAADAARQAEAERAAARNAGTFTTSNPGSGDRQAGRALRPPLALRIDGRPPWSHPLGRLYWCSRCDFLTGGQLQSCPTPHEIPSPDRWITRADLEPDQ